MSHFANAPSPATLLIEAAALGDDSAVAQLLSDEQLLTVEEAARADTRLSSKHFGLTALHRAKTPEVARVLLDFGIPVDCKGAFGQTALHTCYENPAVLALLLDRGADLEAQTDDGSTPLEWAVIADSVESARLLLERGANVQCRNNMGNTPLHLVSSKKMADLLLSFGAKVSAENDEGKIPLETAAERKGEPEFAVITELLLEVSEDRGLRYRTNTSASASNGSRKSKSNKNLSEEPVADSFCANFPEKKSKAKARWALVKERFMSKKQQPGGEKEETLTPLTALKRASTKEWSGKKRSFGDRSSSALSFGSLQALDDDEGNGGGVDSEGDENEDETDEDGEGGEFYRMFFEMAIKERPFLAKKMLDRQRTFLYAKGTSKYYLYDLSLLGGIDSVSDALRLIVECDRRELVAHDVVQWLVTAKWGLFIQSYINHEAAMYMLFMSLFIMSSLRQWFPPLVSHYQALIDVGLFLLSARYVFRLVLEWRHRGSTKAVAMSIFRADKFTGPVFIIALCVLGIKLLFPASATNAMVVRNLETIGSVMLWMRVLYFVEPQYQPIGLTMSIVRRMIVDIMVYLMILLVFVLGFAQAMTVAFREGEDDDPHADPNPSYRSPLASFRTLLFFIFSMDQSTVIEEEDEGKRTLGMILLAFYETLVVVVFLNLVIAVMTTSFEDVMSNAQTEWLLVRAKICVKLEDQTSAWFFNRQGLTNRHERGSETKKRKRTVIVVEQASGENEVAIPVSMLLPPSTLSVPLQAAVDFAKRAVARILRRDYEPVGEEKSSQHSTSAKGARRAVESCSIHALAGNGERIVSLGKFTRFAFHQSQFGTNNVDSSHGEPSISLESSIVPNGTTAHVTDSRVTRKAEPKVTPRPEVTKEKDFAIQVLKEALEQLGQDATGGTGKKQ